MDISTIFHYWIDEVLFTNQMVLSWECQDGTFQLFYLNKHIYSFDHMYYKTTKRLHVK